MQVGWEHFSHDADIGVRGFGRSLAEAFEQVGLALTGVVTDPSSVGCGHGVEIACEAKDAEELLYDWLNALVFEMATRRLLFGRYEVQIEDGRLAATAWGERVQPDRHAPAVEVKGATFTGLRVARSPDEGWVVECVVDV
jgi:tRNA nucleotidyltransferase (CCA-adding enzyme)